MLKLMRDSFQQLKWILVAIVAIFILFIFVDWGAGGARSGVQDRGYAARVNGETISFREYDRALYYMEKNYEQLYRQPLSPEMMAAMGLNRKVLDSLVDSRLMLQQAKRLHLGATPEEVRKFIADPAPDKRARLIDALLKRPEFVDHWALFLGDLFLDPFDCMV